MIRAIVHERRGRNCWYCSRVRAERESGMVARPIIVQPEPEWRPADRMAS